LIMSKRKETEPSNSFNSEGAVSYSSVWGD